MTQIFQQLGPIAIPSTVSVWSVASISPAPTTSYEPDQCKISQPIPTSEGDGGWLLEFSFGGFLILLVCNKNIQVSNKFWYNKVGTIKWQLV